MGIFQITCSVASIRNPKKSVSVPKMLVDSGSELTWIPESLLLRTGVTIAKKDVPFLMANGAQVTRSTGYAILRSGGFETVDEVIFGQSGDLSILGARTLEGFGAVVDPRKKRLVAAGPQPAATSGGRIR